MKRRFIQILGGHEHLKLQQIAFALFKDSFTIGADGTPTNGDIAFPTMILNLLPTGLVGLMIAALLAALM